MGLPPTLFYGPVVVGIVIMGILLQLGGIPMIGKIAIIGGVMLICLPVSATWK